MIGLGACQTKSPEELADLVITNANIYTVNEDQPKAQAVAVRGGRIIYVGDDAGAETFVGEGTETMDLQGKTMSPGLIESHAHIMGVGINRIQLDLLGVQSWEEVVRRVQEAAESSAPGEWIVGRGWHQDKWDSLPRMVEGFPTHHDLTQAAPNNPVYLKHASGHMAIANTAAMEAAGITRETIVPAGGDIIYEEGKPTGLFNEMAQGLINKVVPEPELYPAFGAALQECAENGITTFHDAGSGLEAINVIKEYLEEGKMTTRMYVMLTGRDTALLNMYFETGPEIGLGDDRLTIRSIKMYADGALGSRGAWLHEPYADDPNTVGMATTPMPVVGEVALLGLKHGFQVCTHAIGDRANTEVLDQYEMAFQANPDIKDHRFRIEHAQHLVEEDIPRFGELGVIASMQAIHMASDRPWAIDRLGKDRIEEGAYVWQKLLQSGAKVINGTDAPVEPINPIPSFYASVARKTLQGTPDEGYEVDQSMSRAEALRSYTLDAAYGGFEEGIKGSIEVGKLADFTVYSQDLMTVDEGEILGTKVDMTIVGGEVIFERGEE
ncbi:MAG: amidohydrolase family protein [Bacteroidota bacterium]